jgi:hypothetical protein
MATAWRGVAYLGWAARMGLGSMVRSVKQSHRLNGDGHQTWPSQEPGQISIAVVYVPLSVM